MQAARLVVIVAVLALGAACSSQADGSVTGVVHLDGGPTADATGQPVNTSQPAAGQDVVIVDEHQHRTTVTSDATGRFSLSLPPGTYTLMCGPMPHFTVTAGQTVNVDCQLVVA